MGIYAIVKNGTVSNIVLAAAARDENWVDVTDVTPKPGKRWLYDGAIFSAPDISDSERVWRDSELTATDWVVPTIDHPQHAAYLTYRQALRDYPESEDFLTGIRPEMQE